ncbi:spermidine/putrescine ABC transporter ATP-binding protein [Acuticoccus sediminis]|uniref:Spermidine/putrescine ABC transporter ATP-binding protein n=1 Tax=Acuticoccus sediminis TaxID=2184697 RepID=A0A8B2NGV8_9HYPH|nr:ABC transporter ATP-binding protein [Acuticoccus sediminis]RAH95786.1 spermidine/putrescine ABC transporter ATP-binding protein [Acuticoccus sediminis]
MTTGQSLDVRSVSKRFGDALAVDAVSCAARTGEFVSFLGPSGSGKTTTLNMIAGFETPDSGDILVGGASQTSLAPYRRNIGMVFQNYALFPHLPVHRNVAFPLEVRGTPRREIRTRVARALETVQLSEKAGQLPRQLSGGQQQRVALARALVYEPGLILMDEPLGALDKRLRIDLQSEIKRIQAALGLTIIYVTHDQDEAVTMSDRICLFDGGRIVETGTPSALYETPRTRFTADFLGTSNLIGGTFTHDGGVPVLMAEGGAALPVAEPQGSVPSGTTATLCIRPERIRFNPPAESVDAHWPATIEEAVYCGNLTRYRVRIAGGIILKVEAPNAEAGAVAEGPITLGWKADAAHLILE